MSVAHQIEQILSELVVEFHRYEGRAVKPWGVDEEAWQFSLDTAPQWIRELPVQHYDAPWAAHILYENDE
jgi:hypothetical protein